MNQSSIILVADGLTPATLHNAIRSGDVPELAALADRGTHCELTTVFPSVTGLAYIPMLTGLHPSEAGIPGLRWYDRSRRISRLLGHSRSYVGTQIRSMNDDLAPAARTLYQHVNGNALGMESIITRGLPARNRLDRGFGYAARIIHAHVTGDVARWSAVEESLAERLVHRIRADKPRFVFAAFTAGDKAAHENGVEATGVLRSLKLVDHVARSIRVDAEQDGRWDSMSVWIVSDHGHSPVQQHLDLAAELRHLDVRVRSHPWTVPDRSDAAVMVGGNCMAHVYLDLESPRRRYWSDLRDSWSPRLDGLWRHPAIDLIAVRTSASVIEVQRQGQRAEIVGGPHGFSYRHVDGNPLGLDPFEQLCAKSVFEQTLLTDYPDSVAQLAQLVLGERSGDVVISAAPGWDLRRRYEPIAHVSSHGALHAAHMKVPLVGNRRVETMPRRTTDLFGLVTKEIGVRLRSSIARDGSDGT